MTDVVPIDAKREVDDARSAAILQGMLARPHPQHNPALRRRIRRQAQLMVLVALLVLITAFSVPFVLHYLDIKIP